MGLGLLQAWAEQRSRFEEFFSTALAGIVLGGVCDDPVAVLTQIADLLRDRDADPAFRQLVERALDVLGSADRSAPADQSDLVLGGGLILTALLQHPDPDTTPQLRQVLNTLIALEGPNRPNEILLLIRA